MAGVPNPTQQLGFCRIQSMPTRMLSLRTELDKLIVSPFGYCLPRPLIN